MVCFQLFGVFVRDAQDLLDAGDASAGFGNIAHGAENVPQRHDHHNQEHDERDQVADGNYPVRDPDPANAKNHQERDLHGHRRDGGDEGDKPCHPNPLKPRIIDFLLQPLKLVPRRVLRPDE